MAKAKQGIILVRCVFKQGSLHKTGSGTTFGRGESTQTRHLECFPALSGILGVRPIRNQDLRLVQVVWSRSTRGCRGI